MRYSLRSIRSRYKRVRIWYLIRKDRVTDSLRILWCYRGRIVSILNAAGELREAFNKAKAEDVESIEWLDRTLFNKLQNTVLAASDPTGYVSRMKDEYGRGITRWE